MPLVARIAIFLPFKSMASSFVFIPKQSAAMNIVPRISEGLRSPKVREQHRRLARARGSSTEAVVGGIAEAPPFRNADTKSVVSLPQIDVRKGTPPSKLSREEFENAIAAASPTGFLNPCSANSVPSWMPGRPGRAIMTANVLRLGVKRI